MDSVEQADVQGIGSRLPSEVQGLAVKTDFRANCLLFSYPAEMSSSYNLRLSSYSAAHLDRELALRGAHTSGSVERKRERLQRFVEAEQNATAKFEAKHQQIVECVEKRIQELRNTPVAPPRRSSRVVELQRTIVNVPEVRRSSRIAALLSEYLGY